MRSPITLPFIVSAAAVSGCAAPEYFETKPVEVETPKGVVTCQLYLPEEVAWDQAVLAPPGMSIPEADEICRIEGYRRKKEE
ncbi:hypothetical protein [Ruegeria sp. HKCCD8929]|uniref:hypothetical protein n=1 Tax=Ruegeria sp. HKCCD8929 TaxID=2683006 RepID=UPI0014895127|nr:hypothetical protein [Ruegeria sp. HKCCD8929]